MLRSHFCLKKKKTSLHKIQLIRFLVDFEHSTLFLLVFCSLRFFFFAFIVSSSFLSSLFLCFFLLSLLQYLLSLFSPHLFSSSGSSLLAKEFTQINLDFSSLASSFFLLHCVLLFSNLSLFVFLLFDSHRYSFLFLSFPLIFSFP